MWGEDILFRAYFDTDGIHVVENKEEEPVDNRYHIVFSKGDK